MVHGVSLSEEMGQLGNKASQLSVNLVLCLGNKTEESTINKTAVIISGSDVFAVNPDTATCYSCCSGCRTACKIPKFNLYLV